MAINMKTDFSQFDKEFKGLFEKKLKELIKMYAFCGEAVVKYARELPEDSTYYNRTSNLRSSIGYLAIYKGEVVKEGGFESVGGSESGADGVSTGKSYAMELSSDYQKNLVLIVVAGMKYAAAVQAMDNKDVLYAATEYGNKIIEDMQKQMDKIFSEV